MPNFGYITDLPYETRNLGLACFAVRDEFLENPNESGLKSDIAQKISACGKVFVQTRIPKELSQLAPIFQRCGFYFVESTLIPQSRLVDNIILKNFTLNRLDFVPSRYSLNRLVVQPIDKQNFDIRNNIEEISKNSFIDDRFHLDPNCPDEIADSRFFYWIQDLYSDSDVIFYDLEYDREIIGFMCRKNTNLILAGFAKKYRNSGLGDFLWLSVMQDMLTRGLSQAHTLISANNTAVLNLYARLGFKFKQPAVTFHYWSHPIC
ncbi:MAG: GNAT family N-acetyltransferase [Scytolyngbya sp. HA4215-MV1]|nr:GNAT family N-acetyltransferase [Scytolyngbya sp. HA4215-MV1]